MSTQTVEENGWFALPVPNRSMLGAASGLGAAATSGAESNKSKTKNTQAFTQSEKPSLSQHGLTVLWRSI